MLRHISVGEMSMGTFAENIVGMKRDQIHLDKLA